jgi:transposase
MSRKIQPPPKEWLEKEWLLPPRGKGRSLINIASEVGVSRWIVQNWLKKYGITEPMKDRISAHRKGKATWSKERPAKDELADLYLMPPDGKGTTLENLAKHYQVTVVTIRKWLKHYGLTQPFSLRHSLRMAGEGNVSYKNGTSRKYHKSILLRSSKPKECIWCGTTKRLQVHHVDHDVTNSDIENLEWQTCGCFNETDVLTS